ncbi:hypothetical protein O181_010801 [Austropuccinia psidii MF-1]|uniref:Uncharacterized protein n=1 Tax=Austropuccinia psidii MF-1 TaxID=1389203 RepID=A0A9Q3GKS2_9BASI|nr:hypothetical protein [Austropuccinia psidii MF-1]
MLHISTTKTMLPEVPNIQEEETLRRCLSSNKEMVKTQIGYSFTSLVTDEEEVISLERNYIIKQELKQVASLQATANYEVSQQALSGSFSYVSQWLEYGDALLQKSGFPRCTYNCTETSTLSRST